MRIKKISKQKPKVKSKNKSKNESKAMEEKDFESKESSEIFKSSADIEIKNKPKIKPKMIKSKEQEPDTMDFLKSEINNIIKEDDEKKLKAKKNPKSSKKLKEKEFIKVMASIANSIKKIEIDITRAVNLIKEIFNEPDEKDEAERNQKAKKDINMEKEANNAKGDINMVKGPKKVKKTEGGKGDVREDKKVKKTEGTKEDKKVKKDKVKGDKKHKEYNKVIEPIKDITIQDNNLINPSFIQHSDPSYISFSGESYAIDKIIRKLKDKYKNNTFSSSMTRSGMFTSSKRPKKDEWDTFLENLVEKNLLKKTGDRPVKYKF